MNGHPNSSKYHKICQFSPIFVHSSDEDVQLNGSKESEEGDEEDDEEDDEEEGVEEESEDDDEVDDNDLDGMGMRSDADEVSVRISAVFTRL